MRLDSGYFAIKKDFGLDGSPNEEETKSRPRPSAPPLEWAGYKDVPQLAPVVATPIPQATDVSSDGFQSDTAEGGKMRPGPHTAAGIGAGVLGLLLGGPILAILAGSGAAYAAGRRDGSAAGDIARAVGDVTLTVRDRAREVDDKHHLVDRTKAAAGGAWEKAKALESRHQVSERTKNAISISAQRAVAYNREHRVLEKTSKMVCQFFRFVSKKIWVESKAPATQGPVPSVPSVPAVVH